MPSTGCHSCGMRNAAGVQICVHCGRALRDVTDEELLSFAGKLELFSTEARLGILAQIRERGLPEPPPGYAVAASDAVSSPDRSIAVVTREPIVGTLFILVGGSLAIIGLGRGDVFFLLGGLAALSRGIWHGFLKGRSWLSVDLNPPNQDEHRKQEEKKTGLSDPTLPEEAPSARPITGTLKCPNCGLIAVCGEDTCYKCRTPLSLLRRPA
jgi:hypothetical protein